MTVDVHAAAEGPDTPRMRHSFAGDPWGPCTGCGHPAHHLIHRDDRALTGFVPVSPVAPQLVEALREALNCRHNHTDDEAELRKLWRYVEHEGETWNRCNECGLLELWAAGSFIKADYAALAAVGPETPGTGGADA